MGRIWPAGRRLPAADLDEKLNILAAILAAILDSGDRIATPTSGMVVQPLITHTKWY